jgi:Ca-activated chloride channel family protein
MAVEELAADPQRFVSIVVLTDGENNKGVSFEEFARSYDKRSAIRVFPILFGEGNTAQMTQLAELTGGRTFDAHKSSLVTVFRDIRGYQ